MKYLKVQQLNPEQIDADEEDFSEGKIQTALKSMKNGSAPRPDVILVEFYKVFWLDIKEIFMEALFCSRAQNKLAYHKDKALSPLGTMVNNCRETCSLTGSLIASQMPTPK
ncbi:hypothetical protein PoB_000675700 [Plakobranchus ocellatus]|uniref:Uncharacterized protein n=1 Tax=Plakobranchus ocellatus TaxID=259542 RepID=A0AAV3YBK4_9GAST|nr:hypothetical protein PoB_000675700 [Plakobranchus ocellatus]